MPWDAPVTGIDSSPEMLAALRAAGDGEDPAPVEAVLADIRTYTSQRTAGLVYCVCATLSMLLTPEDQRQAVARAARLLVPGGRFVLETHNKPAVIASHEGRSRTSYFLPYPEPGTGLQHSFSRSEPRESALAYMRGLIAPLQHENGWTMAEHAGHDRPDRIQRMLNQIDWNADEVLNDVREYVVENLADHRAVLIVDDTGFLKKGTGSAGVQRQYSGTAGRTENCR